MFTQKNRDRHTEVVRDELDSMQGQISATWLKEHDETGAHRFPAGDVVPVGAGMLWFSDTAPNSKWLFCRGQQVSRTTYVALFNIFGTTYGAGDGSTTFNLPDLRQRFPLGKADAGTGNTLGATGGAIDHTHSGGSHTHSISSGGSHSHTVSSHNHSISGDSSATDAALNTGAGGQAIAVDHNLDGATINVPTVTIAPLITGHSHTMGGHSHGGATGSDAPGTDSQGAHDHGGATGSASGTTGTANPPYVVVNFLIFSGVEVA